MDKASDFHSPETKSLPVEVASKNPRPLFLLFFLVVPFLVLLAATRPPSLGDTSTYASQIAESLGRSPFGSGSGLWEFGHLLWRPIGWALTTALAPALLMTGWTPYMQVSFVLTAVSVVSSVVSVILWYLLLLNLGQRPRTAILITLALSCGHGFLVYAHSGCAYVPGLTCLTASVYFIRKRSLVAAAFFYALATMLWMPYILSGLALVVLLAAPRDWNVPVKDSFASVRLAPVIRFAAISLSIVLLGYCLGGAARKIDSLAEARAWFSGASHGFPPGFKGLQAVTGLPRSVFYLGRDGMLFKRYLKHDPYAPVGPVDLVRASLWKLAAFYLFAVCLFYELIRRCKSSWPLFLLLAAAGPVLFFAVFLFEPGMPERFLPVVPFLVLAIGWIFRDFSARRPTQSVLALFLAAVVVSNSYSFAAPRIVSKDRVSWSRIADLRQRLVDSGVVMVTTNQDDLEAYLNHSFFGAANRPSVLRMYDIVEPGSLRMLQWKEEFAAKVADVWNHGGEVWLSKRVWSRTPRPEWNWVERDDPREIWSDFTGFFASLAIDAEADGSDGFARLAKTGPNQKILAPLAAAYNPPAPAQTADR